MRTLHNVSPHEKLVARGEYRLMRDGAETGGVETWNLHRMPDGSSVLRADLDARDSDDRRSLLVHAILDPDGMTDRLQVRFEDARRRAEVQMVCFPDYVLVRHAFRGLLPTRSEMDLPDGTFIHVPCTAYSTARVFDVQRGGRQTLDIVALDMTGEDEKLLMPVHRDVEMAFEGTQEMDLPGVRQFQARHFVESEGVRVWLDAHDIVLSRETQAEGQPTTTMTLSQYTHFEK